MISTIQTSCLLNTVDQISQDTDLSKRIWVPPRSIESELAGFETICDSCAYWETEDLTIFWERDHDRGKNGMAP